MAKLKLFASVKVHNQFQVWEVVAPVMTPRGFGLNPRVKQHEFYSIIKDTIRDIHRAGDVVLFAPNSAGYNTAINKDNSKDFFHALSVDGTKVSNDVLEGHINDVKNLLR